VRWKILAQKTETNYNKIQTYLKNAIQYYENSQKMLKKKERGKAGELLWGAVAETAKAFSLNNYDKPINSHEGIKKFLARLSTTYKNEILETWRRSSESLHVNFYETHLDETTFKEYYDHGEQLYAFLKSEFKKR